MKKEKESKSIKEKNQVIVRTGEDHYRTEIRARGHSLFADEPEEAGGANLGPNPYDYLLIALGSCTSITVRMYADRKKWDLEAIEVRLTHDKIHADDCEDCETPKGKIDVIEREISFVGSLDEAQIERLLDIANKCPVHRTLHSEIKVRTRLKET